MPDRASATATELKIIFGEHFRRARQERGLSQRAMAVAHGLSQRVVCAVENGDHNMTFASLVKLAESVVGEVPAMLRRWD
jgi:transcriptional regulator with XRE-family HTH domain